MGLLSPGIVSLSLMEFNISNEKKILFKVRQVESGPNLGRSEAACGQTVNVQMNYYSRAIKTEEKSGMIISR